MFLREGLDRFEGKIGVVEIRKVPLPANPEL